MSLENNIYEKILMDKWVYRCIIILNLLILIVFYIVAVVGSYQEITYPIDHDTQRIVKSILIIIVFISIIFSFPTLLLNIFIFSRLIKWYLSIWKITFDYNVIKSIVNLFLLLNILLVTLYFGFIGINEMINNSFFKLLFPSIHLFLFIVFWFISLKLRNIRLKTIFFSLIPLILLFIIVQTIILKI